MKTPTQSIAKQSINKKLSVIVDLYKDSTISELLNDLVAIGTWPTPEKANQNIKGQASVKIETVPLPEKPKKLKRLLEEVVKMVEDRKVGEVWK